MDKWNSDEPLTISVLRGAPHLNEVLKVLGIIENVNVVVFDDFEQNILNTVFGVYDIPIHLLDSDPLPELVKSNNKLWYQDRKHFKNKKARRKL